MALKPHELNKQKSVYLEIIARESKRKNKKTPNERFFLPMQRDALNYFRKFMDVDLAKPMFELLQYRKENGLTNNEVARLFPKLSTADEEYRHHLERMNFELNQLFNLTPPYIHNLIEAHLKEDLESLENEMERNNLIENIKGSNEKKPFTFKRRDGEIVKDNDDRPISEQLNLHLLKSPYFNEYVELLNIFLDDFKAHISSYIDIGESDYRRLIGLKKKDESGFIEPQLKSYITPWERFIEACEEFSKPKIYEYVTKETKTSSGYSIKKKAKKTKRVIERLGVEDYKWIGLGSPTESLRGFVQVLQDEKLFEHDPGELTKQSAAFFKFFKVGRNYPLYLFHDFLTIASKYKACFEFPPSLKASGNSSELE